ncbi:MAG TPA: SEC-C metal-binding domain-containing protein [Vicinamibacterales bacterium]|nr:SEC-C metal-binding domain-containing protein [Vicinamibacterales bacterium]
MSTMKAGRNDACPCGSGKKFKKCCEPKQNTLRNRGNTVLLVIVGLLMAAGLAAGITSFTSDRAHTGAPTGVWSPEHGHYH